MEFLEDTEKRILLSAISREKKVCEQVDKESRREPHETSLTDICKSLEYKFMYDRLFKKIYEQGRAEFEPLINLLVSMETDVICEEMSTTDYCEQNCKYDCPQKECYLRYLEYMKEQKNERLI